MQIEAHVAVLRGPKQLQFETRPLPLNPLAADSLLCETLVTAISPGTETAAWLGLPPLRSGQNYPRLVGYCNVARVLDCGDECTNLKQGDRILTFSSHCSHFVIPATQVLAVLPPDLPSEHAVTAYLFHLGYSAVLSASKPLGATVAVLGLGVLGITSCAMADLAGWKVHAVTDQAPLLAPQNVIFHRRDNPPPFSSADVVIVTTNSWADWDLALRLAAKRAQIVVLGFPGRGETDVPLNPLRPEDFYQRQLSIIASGLCAEFEDSRGFCPFNERSNIRRILNWFASGRLDPTILKAPCLPAYDLPLLYSNLCSRDRNVSTYVLAWQ